MKYCFIKFYTLFAIVRYPVLQREFIFDLNYYCNK